MSDYDWLIVGAGPQGRFIASAVSAAVARLRVALIDPEPPMAAWRRRARASGMQYLRSSNAHHLGLQAASLRRFMTATGRNGADTLGYYRRPSLALFEQHAESVLAATPHIPAAVTGITPVQTGWRLDTDEGTTHTAGRVVLATGPGRPWRPPGLTDCEHVFDAGFTLGAPGRRSLIVGGGISGAQLALRAQHHGHAVAWLTRRVPEAADFDADPQYAGRRGMTPFRAASSRQRTALLDEARRPGTLPPDIHTAITAAIAAGQIAWIRAEPVARTPNGLRLADGRELLAERVILATGLTDAPADDGLLARTLAAANVADDGAGHVALDDTLQIAAGLHVVGRPASLILGPMAGNIQGARMAGRILADVARADDERRHAVAPAPHRYDDHGR